MAPDLLDDDAAQVAALDAVHELLVADARSWAAQLHHIAALAARADAAGAQVRRTLALELAGSWHVSQLTAELWVAQAERFTDALPVTLSLLQSGQLLRHQAVVLLHRLSSCTPQVARAVEAQVLPAGAGLCPSDLRRTVDRVRLQVESELLGDAAAEQAEADCVASRRTWVRPTDDGMTLAGAVLTPEQGVAWAAGMDALERRERLADRAAGVTRTAEQRRADLFAALPALVLAGTATDDPWRRTLGTPDARVTGACVTGAGAPDAGAPAGRLPVTAPAGTAPLFDTDQPVPPPWTLPHGQVMAQVVLNVHVPCSTVLRRTAAAGTLDGHGPVSAEHVRLLRPHSVRRVMTDARTGRPVAVDDRTTPAIDDLTGQVQDMLRPDVVVDRDEPQHDPSARLARLVDLRDARCSGPGCSSTRCDRDHHTPWPAGPTNARNLTLLSRRCHSAKHHGWTLVRHPDGSTTWHSPLGRSYTRPGPWTPTPPADLYAPPPPAPPPPAPNPHDEDHGPLLDELAVPPPPPDAAVEDQDTPPF